MNTWHVFIKAITYQKRPSKKAIIFAELLKAYTKSFMPTQAIEWIASWTTHHFYANTTRTPMGVEGGGGKEPQSGRLMLCVKWKQLNGISWSYFHLNITHKTVIPMLDLTSQLCGDLQLAGCLSSGDGAIQRSPQHLWMSDRTQKQGAAKQPG